MFLCLYIYIPAHISHPHNLPERTALRHFTRFAATRASAVIWSPPPESWRKDCGAAPAAPVWNFGPKKTISRRNSARKLEISWGHQCMLRIVIIWETTQSTRIRWDALLFNIAMEAMAYQRVKTQQEWGYRKCSTMSSTDWPSLTGSQACLCFLDRGMSARYFGTCFTRNPVPIGILRPSM